MNGPGLERGLEEIHKKQTDEPDHGAHDWTFDDDEEREQHGDDFPDDDFGF